MAKEKNKQRLLTKGRTNKDKKNIDKPYIPNDDVNTFSALPFHIGNVEKAAIEGLSPEGLNFSNATNSTYRKARRSILEKDPNALNTPEVLKERADRAALVKDRVGKGLEVATTAASLAGDALNQAKLDDYSDIEDQINAVENTQFTGSNDMLMSQWNSRPTIEGITASDFRSNTWGQDALSAIKSGVSGASAGLSVGGPIGAMVGAGVGIASSLAGTLVGRHKAKEKAEEMQKEKEEAEARMASNFSNSVQNTALEQLEALELGNIGGVTNAANGGPLNMRYTGTMSPFGNRFDDGGALTNEFSNNVTTINSGGTHEENPLEGVQMGIDPQGIPNLVEEGEVVFDDYVYSDRLKVPKTVRHKYKLRGITFADAAKDAQKESEERPNDPISKNYLDFIMPTLAQEQEEVRAKKLGSNNLQPNQMESINYAACGGRLSNKYDTGSYIVRYTDAEGKQQSMEMDGYYDGYDNNYSFLERNPHLKAVLNNGVQVKNGEMPIFDLAEGYTLDATNKSALKKAKSQDVIKDSPFRYAPIIGSGLAVLNDMFGGNEVDYSNINAAKRALDNSYRPVSPGFLGNYLTFKPYDTQQALNNLNAQQAAARRNIMNLSGGNRATAMAGLLASDYNYGNQVGDILAKAEEVNDTRRNKVAEFNRTTNKYNLESAFNASKFNSELAQRIGSQYPSLYAQRQSLYDANVAEKSANLTNFLNNLGNYGKETYDRNRINYLASKGVIKAGANGEIIVDEDALKKENNRALGGSIKKRKKKGITI